MEIRFSAICFGSSVTARPLISPSGMGPKYFSASALISVG